MVQNGVPFHSPRSLWGHEATSRINIAVQLQACMTRPERQTRMSEDIIPRIRNVLREHGRLSVDAVRIENDADLYEAGLTSHASVSIMLALESEFDIEFPDQMLSRGVFSSVAAIRNAVDTLIAA
jgi:acyl carrier protein